MAKTKSKSDDKAAQLVAAVEAQSGAARRPASSSKPKDVLRDLVENATTDAVRLNATKALMELEGVEREDRRLKAAAREATSPQGEFADMTTEEIFEKADEETAANLSAVLNAPRGAIARTMPATARAVERTLERRIAEGVEAELAKLNDPAEFEARVEVRARELAGQIAPPAPPTPEPVDAAAESAEAESAQAEPAEAVTAAVEDTDAADAPSDPPPDPQTGRSLGLWPDERPAPAPGLLPNLVPRGLRG